MKKVFHNKLLISQLFDNVHNIDFVIKLLGSFFESGALGANIGAAEAKDVFKQVANHDTGWILERDRHFCLGHPFRHIFFIVKFFREIVRCSFLSVKLVDKSLIKDPT